MAVKYSVSNGGFIQDATAVSRYVFELSGDLDVPAGLVLPYQYIKNAITLSSVTAVFSTAGTATYTLTVISTDNAGANSVTHVSGVTLTPTSGGKLTATISTASIAADRIARVTLTSGSGTVSTDFTLILE